MSGAWSNVHRTEQWLTPDEQPRVDDKVLKKRPDGRTLVLRPTGWIWPAARSVPVLKRPLERPEAPLASPPSGLEPTWLGIQYELEGGARPGDVRVSAHLSDGSAHEATIYGNSESGAALFKDLDVAIAGSARLDLREGTEDGAFDWLKVLKAPGTYTYERQPSPLKHYVEFPGEATAIKAETGQMNTVALQTPREVVIQITTGAGTPLEVSAPGDPSVEDSWTLFYDTREGEAVGRATFAEGEEVRLLVPRRYTGPLVIDQGGQELTRIDLGALGLDPEGVEPVVFQLGPGAPIHGAAPDNTCTYIPDPQNFASPVEEEVVFMAAPRRGPLSEGLYTVSELNEEEEAWLGDVLRENLLSEVVATGSDVALDVDGFVGLMKERGTKFYLKRMEGAVGRGRWAVVFRGWPQERSFLTGSWYGLKSAKVVRLTGGSVHPGASAAGALKGFARGGGAVALVFVGGLEVQEWLAEGEEVGELLARLGMVAAKALLTAAITAGAVAAILFALAMGGLTLTVGTVVAGGIIIGIGIGLVVEWVDNKLGVTERVKAWVRDLELLDPLSQGLERAVEELYGGSDGYVPSLGPFNQ